MFERWQTQNVKHLAQLGKNLATCNNFISNQKSKMRREVSHDSLGLSETFSIIPEQLQFLSEIENKLNTIHKIHFQFKGGNGGFSFN